MRHIFLFVSVVIVSMGVFAQSTTFVTHYEKSGYKQTPRYAETVEFCKNLDQASQWLFYTTFGKSPQGRDLPLLIADKNGNSTAEAVRKSGNVVLLIQACIHAGEPDGKDAGLMLLRDIAISKKYPELLNHVSILFIPIFNTDGHERFGPYNRINQNGPEEMGWRTTAQNLNLNRDYVKADAPEMQAWLKLYTRWLPDFFVDCHVTDGADYQYPLTYVLESRGNLEGPLSDWAENNVKPFLVKNMNTAGYPIFPYVEFRNWHDPLSGLTNLLAAPMLSNGYVPAQNRPALLIETHMLKPYQTRVSATYNMLKLVLEILNSDYANLKKMVKNADEYAASGEFRKKPFALSYSESFTDSTYIDFKGFDYKADTSELTGGKWFKFDNTKPTNWKIVYFPNSTPENLVNLPEAYLIPPQYAQIIERLKLHGVKMQALSRETTVKVKTTRFSNARWQQRPYEGRHKVNYQLNDSIETQIFPAGTMLVPMSQRAARIIAYALEPKSPESFASWGFFDGVMEQKEYSESYVMETMAREMMQKNPSLKVEFEKLKASDKNFAKNPDAMLNWFYSKSPYWDNRYNLYPIARVIDSEELKKLLGK